MAARTWKRCSSTLRANAISKLLRTASRWRNNDRAGARAYRVCSLVAPRLCPGAETHLFAAQLRPAHSGARVLADGADGAVGLHHDVPDQSQLVDCAGPGGGALRR